MDSLRGFVSRYLYAIFMLLIAGAFLMVVAELLLDGHTDGTQMVGVIASIVGLAMAVIALFLGTRGRNVVAILFLVLSLSGVMGVYQHYAARSEGEVGEAAPPLAPLSLAGTSLMAAVALLGIEKPVKPGA